MPPIPPIHQTGLQEKAAFVAATKALAGSALHSEVMQLPAALVLVLVLLAMTMLYHQVDGGRYWGGGGGEVWGGRGGLIDWCK